MSKIVLPAQHPFRGIAEKLNRSHENVKNLEAEIGRFFQECEYPLLSNDKGQVIPEAVEYHSKLSVPPRFSVLSGEIIHHLRSCLDHIIWHFSDTEYRRKYMRWVEFPILKYRPSPAHVSTQYERKIKGIADTRVLSLIGRVQPYNSSGPPNSILLAIHNFDIVDKHRALVIVASTGAFEFPLNVMRDYRTDLSETPFSSPSDFVAELKRHGKLIPQVAFSDFIGGESETVIQALAGMHNAVLGIVSDFSKFLTLH
jgi:hypothetical protein